jgi:phage-related protein
MALTIGRLVGFIDADDRGMRRGLTDAELRMRGLQRHMDGRLRDLRGRFVSESEAMGRALGDRIGGGGDRANLSLGRIVKQAAGLAGVAGKVGMIAAKIGGAVPLAAGLAAALADILPAAGIAATGVLAVVSATAALKIGMSGVSDAITAAFDPKKAKLLDDALKRLSPNARAFVVALSGLKPQLDAIKRTVQDQLFQGLDDQLKTTATSTLPVFQQQLQLSAGALNLMARGVADAARDLADSGTLGEALSSANAGLVNLSGAPGLVVQALGQIGAAAGPSFDRLTAAGGDALDRLSGKLDKAFKSGALQDAIETAIGLVGDLVDVAGNVGSILADVFKAAQVSGGGFIGTLKTVSGALADVFGNPGVQAGLQALFGTMAQLATTVAPLLAEAVTQLGPVLDALGAPVQVLIGALGDALEPIIKALGPVLVDAAAAIGQLVVSAAPLLPVIGKLVASLLPPLSPLLDTLAGVFLQLEPVVQQVADALGTGGLQPVITGLGDILSQFVTSYAAMFLDVLEQLLPVIPQLVPVVLQLASSLGEILSALAPLLPQITMLGTQMVTQLLPAIIPLIPPLLQFATVLLRIATRVITGVVIPALSGLVGFLAGLRGKLSPAIDAVTWLTKGIAHVFEWLYDHLVGHSVIPDLVREIVRWFASLPGKAAAALASLGSKISGKAREAGAALVRVVREKLSDTVTWLKGLPKRAQSALGGLGSTLVAAGRSLISGLIKGITSKISSVKSTLTGLTDKIKEWKGPAKKDASLLTPAGKLLIKGLIAGIDASTASLKSKLARVTALIERAMTINKSNSHKVSGLSALASLVDKDNKVLLKLAAARDTVAAKLKTAQAKLDDLKKAFASEAASVSATIMDSFDITRGGASTNTVDAITVSLQRALNQAKTFAANLAALKKKGLSSDLIQQIGEEGVSGGGATAQALAGANAWQILKVNTLQKQLKKVADKTGTTVASSMYSSGIQAAQGIVDGLKKKEKDITDAMTKIAKAIVKALKKELDMHSPSRKLHKLSSLAAQGMANGFDAMRGKVASAAGRTAQAALDAAGAASSAFSPAAPAFAGAAGAGTGRTGNNYSTTNVYNLQHRAITVQELGVLQRRQDAAARVGRPR